MTTACTVRMRFISRSPTYLVVLPHVKQDLKFVVVVLSSSPNTFKFIAHAQRLRQVTAVTGRVEENARVLEHILIVSSYFVT